MQYRKRMLRKKGTALLLSALLLASALPLAAYAEEVSAKTTEYVNFRSGPGTNYSSQGIIASGTTITVTDTSNSEWYAVRLSNGSTGYIFAQYLKLNSSSSATATPAPTQAPSGSEQSAKTTEYVNFRSGPGTNYSSKGVIASGTTVTVTDRSNSEWYAVRLANGSTGYIFAQYLKVTGTSSATPTQAPSNDGTVQAKLTADVNLPRGAGGPLYELRRHQGHRHRHHRYGHGRVEQPVVQGKAFGRHRGLSVLRISESYFRQY